MKESTNKLGQHRPHLLFLILALTLVRGILYTAVVPPWQHYDEPTHFEYVRLIAERRRIPEPGDFDLEMRRAIASSMVATGFWKDKAPPALNFRSEEPPWIGISELGHPPLYYALLALPQLLVQHQSVEAQLYLARLLSLFVYPVVVASAYGLVAEAFPRRRMLPLAVAAFVALLPPFTDLMSAVNNDAAATAAVSLLLWAGVRLIRRGASGRRVGVTLLLVGICFATKSTAQFVTAAILPVLAVALIPSPLRRWAWVGLALLVPLALLSAFTSGGHAAYWLSRDQPAVPNRIATDAVLGRSAFALSADGERHPRMLFQELRTHDGRDLKGHTVTLGAWLKAGKGKSGLAILQVDEGLGLAKHRQKVETTDDWHFHTMTATIGAEAPGVAVQIVLPEHESAAEAVYVDGVVLLEGEVLEASPPQFDSVEARAGQWGARPFTNLVRNASAEQYWPGLRPWLGSRNLLRYYPLPHVLYSVLDWKRTGWVYRQELYRLVTSFWGRFGWSHLVFPTALYYPWRLITVVAIIGSGLGLVRWVRSSKNKQSWQWHVLALLAVALLAGWGGTIIRVHPVLLTWWGVFWPDARYAFVVIVPTAAALCYGLAEIVPRRWLGEAAWVGLLAMVLLDLLALWTLILPYYYG